MIKAILFDMDGLMFDTETAYSIVQTEMFRKRGKEFTLAIKRPLMGKRANEVIERIIDIWGTKERPENVLQEQDELLKRVFKESVAKLSGLDEIIQFLVQNNIRRCIGTSSRKFLVDILLEKYNLTNKFEFVVSGDLVSRGKPDPEIYNRCIEKIKLSPTECLVLEDSLNGVRAGIAAGCFVCAIPSEFTHEEDFSSATFIAESLADEKIKNFIFAK